MLFLWCSQCLGEDASGDRALEVLVKHEAVAAATDAERTVSIDQLTASRTTGKTTSSRITYTYSDSLTCPICFEAFVDPSACERGHVFCRACIETALRRRKVCPLCCAETTRDSLQRCNTIRQRADRVRVDCPRKCGWSGAHSTLKAHALKCRVIMPDEVALEVPDIGDAGLGLRLAPSPMEAGRKRRLVVLGVDDGGALKARLDAVGDPARGARPGDVLLEVDGVRSDDLHTLVHMVRNPTDRCMMLLLKRPREFRVKGQTPLGVVVAIYGTLYPFLVLEKVQDPTVMSATEPANFAFRKQDHIFEVNGCQGDVKAMLKLIMQDDGVKEYSLLLRRFSSDDV